MASDSPDVVKLLLDRAIVPVTQMFDAQGLGVDKWSDAHTFVAGPLKDGRWLAAACADYQESRVQ